MKKFVAFLIAIAYAISIVVITFFGQQIDVSQFHILLNYVEITGELVNGKLYGFDDENDSMHQKMEDIGPDGKITYKKIIFKYFQEGREPGDSANSIYLDYDYGPDNATMYKTPGVLKFELSGEVKKVAKKDDQGEIIKDDDGNTLYDEITCATINQMGEVNFTQTRTVTVYLYTEDGSNLKDMVTISCIEAPIE